ncbi:hypothetical protein JOQ06_027185 [Pogonophryne albipinna]|uniref:Uncharacterized protein n=1 Tax=Pogonophryne albipinna TaxID=1090488 RepID=A0AAD6BDQ4_9TELE|nr:hypothetical protein JOQ06_027185 [Pogonophryne albipinna]
MDTTQDISKRDQISQALSAYRDDFDQVKRTAQNLAERWGAQKNSRARKLNLSSVVDDFAERKARKINF